MLIQHPHVQWIHCESQNGFYRCRCQVCGEVMPAFAHGAQADAFAGAHAEHRSAEPTHYGAGDLVARATKAMGMAPCTPCEARRRQLNGLLPRVWRR